MNQFIIMWFLILSTHILIFQFPSEYLCLENDEHVEKLEESGLFIDILFVKSIFNAQQALASSILDEVHLLFMLSKYYFFKLCLPVVCRRLKLLY